MLLIKSAKKHRFKLACFLILILATFVYIYNLSSIKNQLMSKYELAIEKMDTEEYDEAIELLRELGDYKDSVENLKIAEEKVKEIQRNGNYEQAVFLYETGRYEDAYTAFFELGDFRDSRAYLVKIEEAINKQDENQILYDKMLEYYNSGKYEQALAILEKLGDYEDCVDLTQNINNILKRLELSKTISAGIFYSAAVTQKGQVSFSGVNFSGQSDIENWEHILSISVMGNIVIGLKEDGTVVTATINNYRLGTETWNDVIQVSAGEQYIIGLKEDGTLLALGHNGDRQTNIDDWKNIVSIDTGWRHTVGLDSAGYVHITGFGDKRQEEAINSKREDDNMIIAVAAGGGEPGVYGEAGHTVALRQDHTVVAVGDNNSGQCNVEEWEDIISISAGANHTVGLRQGGTVVTTQDKNSDSYKEISSWNDIVAISAGYHFTLGLKSDGTIVGAGYDKDGQRNTNSWSEIAIREEWSIFDDQTE